MSFLDELKRRNVFRVAGLYAAGTWLVVQVAGTVLPMFDAPAWIARAILIALVVGFVPAMVFAWAFELTPEGLKREQEVDRTESIIAATGSRLDRGVMVVLALAVGYFAFDKFVLAPQRELAVTETAREAGRSEARVESYGDKSIAVLPFRNLSSDKDQEYFSDGISEELLNLLVKIPELRVISRSSSFSYKGKDVRLAQIAQELNVAHVLEGSVRKAGNRVRIVAQLIDARADTQLWSDTYDRSMDDIFAVQDEISAAVVAQLKLKLLRGAPRAKAVNEEAYALYLQARDLSRRRTERDGEQATLLYRRALDIDPRYAPAWAALADHLALQADLGYKPIAESYALALEAAEKALQVDPSLAKAHAVLGWLASAHDWDLESAARHYERALDLEPNNTELLSDTTLLLLSLGRLDTTLVLNRHITSRDPLNVQPYLRSALAYNAMNRPDEALASLQVLEQLNPDYGGLKLLRCMALLRKGDAHSALVAIQRDPTAIDRLIGLAMVWHALGDRAKSDAALSELISKYEQEVAFNIAAVLAYRGESDRAFEWLNKAVGYRDPGLTGISFQWEFDNIRKDPRWLPFLRKINAAPEQLAKIKFAIKIPT